MCTGSDSLKRGPKRSRCEVLRVLLEFDGDAQDIKDTSTPGCLLNNAASRVEKTQERRGHVCHRAPWACLEIM